LNGFENQANLESAAEDSDTEQISRNNNSQALILSSSSTGDINNSTEKKKRKRKSYYIPKYQYPRILKRDVRRDYAVMLTNVLNAADENLLAKFLNRYAMNSCQYVDCFPDENINYQPFVRYAQGIDAIVYRLIQDFSSIPDFVIRLLNSHIIQRHDTKEGSQIVCNVEFSGTKMFYYKRPDLITSVEEMKIAEEKAEKKKSNKKKLKELAPVSKVQQPLIIESDHETKDGILPTQIPSVREEDSPESSMKKSNLKCLSLYAEQYQQLTGKEMPLDLGEMKLTNEELSHFMSLPPEKLQELAQMYSSFMQEEQPPVTQQIISSESLQSLIHTSNEEKIDLSAFIPSSSSSSFAPPTDDCSTLSASSSSCSLASTSTPIVNTHLLAKNDKPLLSKPISIKFAGTITLSLNEEHCLCQFEVKSNLYDMKFVLPNASLKK
jgi:hypothetical protein